MTYTSIRRKVATLIMARAVLSTVLLGWGTIAEITAPGSFSVDPFFILIAVTYGLTIVWASTLRLVDRSMWLIDLQLGLDALLVSASLYVTGGITSYFASVYVLPIIAASGLRQRSGALLVATMSGVLYLAVVLGQYFTAAGILRDPWVATNLLTLPTHRVAQFTVALNIFG